MFDITSSKLLILGLVALIVIGPKDLPALLRTLGKYMGMIKRQASEFRSQFEDAMRESELAEMRKEVDKMAQEAEASMRQAESKIQQQLADARTGTDPNSVLGDPFADPPPPPSIASDTASAPAASPDAATASVQPETSLASATETTSAGRASEKSGA